MNEFSEIFQNLGLSDVMSDVLNAIFPILVPFISFNIVLKILHHFIFDDNAYVYYGDYDKSIDNKDTVIKTDTDTTIVTVTVVSDDTWKCSWCGTAHIGHEHLTCPNCGGTRL